MTRSKLFYGSALTFSLVISGCGSGQDGTPAGDSAASMSVAAAPGMPEGVMEPVVLTEADVEHFIAATKELQTLGLEAQNRLGDDPSTARGFFAGLATNAQAIAILRKHGFDVPRYQRVTFSVMMAYGAEDLQKNAPSDEEMAAQLEQMKAQLSKEQYEQMKQMTANASATVKAMQNQPQSNIDLVERYRPQIDELSKR